MCRCLEVSPGGFYAWLARPVSKRAAENQRLRRRMRDLHKDHHGVLGAPRMHEELFYEGESLSLNRVARLMAVEGLQGIPQRRGWRGKRSGSRPMAVSNHLERDFSAAAPNERWVTDITYIRTGEGWLYLAAVIDLYNNVVIGWSMSARQDRHLVLKAVLMAIW